MNLAGQEKSLKILNEKPPEVKRIPLRDPSDYRYNAGMSDVQLGVAISQLILLR